MTATELEPTAQELQSNGHTNITSELTSAIDFISFSVHLWRGQYKARSAQVTVADTDVQKLVTKPRWDLMPETWHKRFTIIEGKIRSAVNQAAVLNPADADEDNEELRELFKFPVRGVRIIPRSNRNKLFDEIDTVENEEFKPAVDEFVAAWSAIREQIRVSVASYPPEIWNAISALLPATADKLRRYFWVDKLLVPIKMADDTELELLTGEKLEQHMDRARVYGANFTQRVTQMIIEGLESELKSAVDNLTNRIKEGGVIKEGTLNPVRNAFQKFKSFDFLMTDDLQTRMAIMAVTLGEYDCTDLNKDLKEAGAKSITVKIASGLKEIREKCVADMAVAKSRSKGWRNIRI